MKHQMQRDVSEVAECIRGAWRWMEQMEQMELEVNRVSTHQRQSEQLELVRTCWDRMELVHSYFCCM
jgi:hypothetical protein